MATPVARSADIAKVAGIRVGGHRKPAAGTADSQRSADCSKGRPPIAGSEAGRSEVGGSEVWGFEESGSEAWGSEAWGSEAGDSEGGGFVTLTPTAVVAAAAVAD